MSKLSISWTENTTIGLTTDSYRVEIVQGSIKGRFVMTVTSPTGATLQQFCSSAWAAKANAETEIENHRRRGGWTR